MSDRSRRIFGAVIGLIVGLGYGLVSQLINVIVLPEIPVYQAGPGPAGMILFITLGGGLMGLIASWSDETIPGVIASSLVTAALSTLASIIAVRASTVSTEKIVSAFAVLFITFLPRAILFVPVAGLIRWVVNIWQEEVSRLDFSIQKMALSLSAVVLLALVTGSLSLYPEEARYAFQRTEDLIRAGMRAEDWESLPEPLKPVDGFLQGAEGEYYLVLGEDPDVLPVKRPMASYTVMEYAVFVIFENGYQFGCAFTPPHPNPSCGIY